MPEPEQLLYAAEHARRLGVSPSAVSHALRRAATAHRRDPAAQPPPGPDFTDPTTGRPKWRASTFDVFWDARPGHGPGRPAAADLNPTAEPTTDKDSSRP
jgi:hypothetical protein